MPLTLHPDLFRRIEHIGIPTDPANTLTYVWCHGVSHCLALPQGDVEVWVDVPDDRRNEDEQERWFGKLDPMDGRLYVGLPELRKANDPDHIVQPVWPTLPFYARRRIVETLIARVTLLPVGRGCRRFDPSSLRIEWTF